MNERIEQSGKEIGRSGEEVSTEERSFFLVMFILWFQWRHQADNVPHLVVGTGLELGKGTSGLET